MKALVKAKAERGIWMEDIEPPKVGHNDVLIKIKQPPSAALTSTFTSGTNGRSTRFPCR